MKKATLTKKILTKKTIAAAMAASALLASGTKVSATVGDVYDTELTQANTTTFEKYLLMDKQAQVPNAVFSYTITAGEAKAYDVNGKKFEVLAGINAENVVMTGSDVTEGNKVKYTPKDQGIESENQLVKGYDTETQKYARKTVTLNFAGCEFPEPGIYRYVLTEEAVYNQAITNDEDSTRILDVYIYDDSSGDEKKLKIGGYVLHSAEDDTPDIAMGMDYGSSGAYPETKSQGFTNVYDTSDLTIRKEVSGNQASRDKYFQFTVKISDAVPGTVYKVDITEADAITIENAATISENALQSNPDELTVGSDGSVEENFYLQHGQQITIQGIAKGTNYKVTESEEDYKSTPAGVTDYKDNVEGTIESLDLKTSYLNTRNGVIPTGVLMTVAPFTAVTLIAGIGAVTIIMRRRSD